MTRRLDEQSLVVLKTKLENAVVRLVNRDKILDLFRRRYGGRIDISVYYNALLLKAIEAKHNTLAETLLDLKCPLEQALPVAVKVRNMDLIPRIVEIGDNTETGGQWWMEDRNSAMEIAIKTCNFTVIKALLKFHHLERYPDIWKPLESARFFTIQSYLRWLTEQAEKTINALKPYSFSTGATDICDFVTMFLQRSTCMKNADLASFLLSEFDPTLNKHPPPGLTPTNLAKAMGKRFDYDHELSATELDFYSYLSRIAVHIQKGYKCFLNHPQSGIKSIHNHVAMILEAGGRLLQREDSLDYESLWVLCSFLFKFARYRNWEDIKHSDINYVFLICGDHDPCCPIIPYLIRDNPGIYIGQDRDEFYLNRMPKQKGLDDILALNELFLKVLLENVQDEFNQIAVKGIIEETLFSMMHTFRKVRHFGDILIYNDDDFESTVAWAQRIFELYLRNGYKYRTHWALLEFIHFQPERLFVFYEMSLSFWSHEFVKKTLSKLVNDVTEEAKEKAVLNSAGEMEQSMNAIHQEAIESKLLEALDDLSMKLMTLKSMCKRTIVTALGESPMQQIKKLHLPLPLNNYLESCWP